MVDNDSQDYRHSAIPGDVGSGLRSKDLLPFHLTTAAPFSSRMLRKRALVVLYMWSDVSMTLRNDSTVQVKAEKPPLAICLICLRACAKSLAPCLGDLAATTEAKLKHQ